MSSNPRCLWHLRLHTTHVNGHAADTVPAVVTIGVYADDNGIVQGAAPAPCSNPETDPVAFELTSNEWPCRMECRLSRWSEDLQDFDGAVERWSPATVARWLRLPSHLSEPRVNADLTPLAAVLGNITGRVLVALDSLSLRAAPYLLDSDTHPSPRRDALLNAVANQAGRYRLCASTNEPGPAVARYNPSELDHGLTLFQARCTDTAQNIGDADEHIWFVDRIAPGLRFVDVPPPPLRTRDSHVRIAFTGVETTGHAGLSYVDHAGKVIQPNAMQCNVK